MFGGRVVVVVVLVELWWWWRGWLGIIGDGGVIAGDGDRCP